MGQQDQQASPRPGRQYLVSLRASHRWPQVFQLAPLPSPLRVHPSQLSQHHSPVRVPLPLEFQRASRPSLPVCLPSQHRSHLRVPRCLHSLLASRLSLQVCPRSPRASHQHIPRCLHSHLASPVRAPLPLECLPPCLRCLPVCHLSPRASLQHILQCQPCQQASLVRTPLPLECQRRCRQSLPVFLPCRLQCPLRVPPCHLGHHVSPRWLQVYPRVPHLSLLRALRHQLSPRASLV